MKNLYILLLLATMLIQGCKQGSPLEEKKKELTQYKKDFAALKDKISNLEKDISKQEGKDTVQKGKPVFVQTITPSDFAHYIEIQGKVESEEHVNVTPFFSGTVTRVFVNEGDVVKKGQVLAEIDAATLLSQIQGAKTQVEFAKTLFEKQKKLRAQNIGTEVQYLQAKAQLEGAEAQLETLQRQYNNSRVVSPINGVIDSKDAKVGSIASTMFPMFSIVGSSGYKVVADVAESYLSDVRKGLNVIVSFPDIKHEIKGTITNVSQSINPSSRTFKVEIKVSDAKKLRPNLISVVKIKDFENGKSITVPVNSIQHSDEGDFVFTAKMKVDHYVASKKMVVKGITYGGKTQILEGLNEGDKVVTTGYQDLVDDQRIKVKN